MTTKKFQNVRKKEEKTSTLFTYLLSNFILIKIHVIFIRIKNKREQDTMQSYNRQFRRSGVTDLSLIL